MLRVQVVRPGLLDDPSIIMIERGFLAAFLVRNRLVPRLESRLSGSVTNGLPVAMHAWHIGPAATSRDKARAMPVRSSKWHSSHVASGPGEKIYPVGTGRTTTANVEMGVATIIDLQVFFPVTRCR